MSIVEQTEANNDQGIKQTAVRTEPVSPQKAKKDLSVYVYGLIITQVISLVAIAYLWSTITAIQTSVTSINTLAQTYDERIQTLSDAGLENAMSIYMSEGVVTDNLVAKKVTFFDNVMSIDMRAQPNFEQYFKGQGRFDLSDRELKQAILSLIDAVKLGYIETDTKKFADLKISITQNNYPVGEYEHGTLKLTGEN